MEKQIQVGRNLVILEMYSPWVLVKKVAQEETTQSYNQREKIK